jgi:two-component system response regulator CpxR
MPSGTIGKNFQWVVFAISIGGTLQGFLPKRTMLLVSQTIRLRLRQTSTTGRQGTVATFGGRMKPKRTILCVDDNEQSLSIRKVLLETRGYRVIVCHDAEEALARFRKGGIDLVLSDLMMPGIDGAKLIEQIKALSPRTPAILLSGKVRIYDQNTQADVFLPKGMHAPAELLERIRLLLVRKRGPSRPRPQAEAGAAHAEVA